MQNNVNLGIENEELRRTITELHQQRKDPADNEQGREPQAFREQVERINHTISSSRSGKHRA